MKKKYHRYNNNPLDPTVTIKPAISFNKSMLTDF